MNTEQLDTLLAHMLATGISHVSFSHGEHLISMTLPVAVSGTEQIAIPGNAPVSAPPAPAGIVLSSPAIGQLLAYHPARPGAIFNSGDRVGAGDAVAFVRTGYTLSAITAPVAGTLGPRLAEPGAVVGYGAAVFELIPDITA